jgi:hypothetical protein
MAFPATLSRSVPGSPNLKNRFTNLTRRGIECLKRACPPVAFWIPLEKLSPLLTHRAPDGLLREGFSLASTTRPRRCLSSEYAFGRNLCEPKLRPKTHLIPSYF